MKAVSLVILLAISSQLIAMNKPKKKVTDHPNSPFPSDTSEYVYTNGVLYSEKSYPSDAPEHYTIDLFSKYGHITNIAYFKNNKFDYQVAYKEILVSKNMIIIYQKIGTNIFYIDDKSNILTNYWIQPDGVTNSYSFYIYKSNKCIKKINNEGGILETETIYDDQGLIVSESGRDNMQIKEYTVKYKYDFYKDKSLKRMRAYSDQSGPKHVLIRVEHYFY